ncbi:MAG: hypothetical protein H0T47_20465 [Planctomycetaceae bacterium]|nr:hypothetical protein [Planctomycetaceae bacterium]
MSIQTIAPQTWLYLCRHQHLFEQRKSSIYRRRPDFAIFGIGKYSFAPYKVAIAGLSKELAFRKVTTLDKPVVFDDTACFLPASSEHQVDLFLTLLNSRAGQEFLSSLIFWDSKRPITVDVLEALNLTTLADEVGLGKEIGDIGTYELECLAERSPRQGILFG